MNFLIKKKIKNYLVIFLPIFFVNFVVIILAWNTAGQPPPGGNVPIFLDDSDNVQFKLGALGVGGVLETTQIKFDTGEVEMPECTESIRGMIWVDDGDVAQSDRVMHCLKDSEDNYSWVYIHYVEGE